MRHCQPWHRIIYRIWAMDIGGRLQAIRIADYLYKNATVCMERKFNRTQKWKMIIPQKRERNKKGQFI